MQIGVPLHRADLAVAEEAAERDVAEVAACEVGVVVGPPVEVHAAAELARSVYWLSICSRSCVEVAASRT